MALRWVSVTRRRSLIGARNSTPNPQSQEALKSRMFGLGFTHSATHVLNKWVGEGNKVTISELPNTAKDLRKAHRHNHALELLSWMKDQNSFRMSAADHAILLQLIIEVHGLAEAEEYFEKIPDTSSQKAACIPLLHSYVKERATGKADSFMLKIRSLGLTVNSHPFNAMMKLYVATSQFEKVPFMIQQMKHDRIPRDVLSYNLWMSASSALSGVSSAETVFAEMLNDKTVKVGWSTHITLANIYIKSGFIDKATAALRIAEQKLSTQKRLGYFFLITLYANLRNKDGVLRCWEGSKAVPGRITCSNYMCVLSCLVKIGDITEAERIFKSWELERRKYDIRVSNILLGAYVRVGQMDKAEKFHLHTLEKGGCPNYKTWEILMEGWVRSKEMDKAINAMKKGFSMLKHCDWHPSSTIIMEIMNYFEERGDSDNAMKYVEVLRPLGFASLPLYKSLLKVHVCANKPAPDIIEMIQNDKIDIDEETSALVKCLAQLESVGIL